MNSRKSLYDKQEFYRKGAILKASFQGMRYQVENGKKTMRKNVFALPYGLSRFALKRHRKKIKPMRIFRIPKKDWMTSMIGSAPNTTRRKTAGTRQGNLP